MQNSLRKSAVSTAVEPDVLRIRRILVALDFGDQSARVLEAALRIARSFKSELFLVHAVSPHSSDAGGKEDTGFLEACVQAGMRKLREAVAVGPSLDALTHHEIAAVESPLDLMQRLVASEDIDLIVAGSHGASGFERLALGSFPEGLMRRANCPTLIVGPRAVIASDPFHRVLLATDLSRNCVSATRYAAAIAMHAQGELDALHVIDKKTGALLSPPLRTEEMAARHRMRDDLPPDVTSRCSVRLIAGHGAPDEVIVNSAAEYEAGVIVTGVSQGLLHDEHSPWSTFASIVRAASCPVLAIRHDVQIMPAPAEAHAVIARAQS